MTVASGADARTPLREAYAACERIARRHYENFPVASRLLPPVMRPHIAAIYAFARTADDFADEPGMADDERLRRLDEWHAALHARNPTSSLFVALQHTIGEHRLPLGLFDDLLSAFRQDVGTTRYRTWTELLDYCRRSANPIGRLVLRVAGYEDARLDTASDCVCTALQLTNFWQDLEIDWARGRLYVPLEERDRAAAREEDLGARRMTAEWRAALAAAAARTRALFHAGRAVCDGVTGRLRFELRVTWLGGTRILEKLDAVRFDVFARRPTLGAADLPVLVWRAATWRKVRRGAGGC